MSDESQRWKEKYLKSLEEQESLEQRWKTRVDLMRRGLVRSSLAAEGTDKAVDTCMRELREVVRTDDMAAGLGILIPRLEKTLLDAEQRRQERLQQISSALAALVQQLIQLPLPSELRKPLRRLARSLAERLERPLELPLVLAELSDLQSQALGALETPQNDRRGLLERLFGGREQVAQASADDQVAASNPAELPAPPPALASSPTPPPPTTPAAVARSLPPATSMLDSLPLPSDILTAGQKVNAVDEGFDLPANRDPGYGAIADHIEKTLLGLLEGLEIPAQHQPQVESLRERISHGLNLYELVTVLDDLAVLVQAVATRGVHEFEGYLKQLNERLAVFQESLRTANVGHAESLDEARRLDDELREQVGGLQSCVLEAVDLDGLKSAVEGRLDGLLGTMEQYRRQRETREQEVAERLQALVAKVESMEQEARNFHEHLEVQRQKALIDALTGLPNRAAWAERLELEVARWQRYGGELLMAVLDVDLFKRINDDYGHLAGDKVLKLIATELARRLRKTDFIARFGGEEFVVLLPSTPLEGGQQLMDSLRLAIEACPFHFKGERVTITISIGLCAFTEKETAESVFERADQALYKAKRDGRNRIQLG
ncbi:GGDEF domain-containing protein [Pseudomonas mangrovi]|uniref:diguanylate cyclase n=1 Tax=Pseudomonas mangrovi TaxID=2161748 RepID=A0A2T5P9R8_9PSED|nr:GGDEF domain-containing protein [Pseudomonas mangrovi]PTU74431.1 GGDEF domain-containing protein [Pseudomonas mangrovi]